MVKIIADSTCDLSKELLEQYEIDILPLHILLGEQEYEDGVSITPDEIFAWSDKHDTTPKTSAPSIGRAMEILRPYVKEGREVVCFSIAGGMSTSGNVMRMAAAELDAEELVTVVDSANLTVGIGLLVIEAAIWAKEGKSASEIAAYMEELKPRVRSSFVVDTLTYLYRGGRCSGAAALAGGALKLHPKIVVENGAMRPDKKYRGKMSKVLVEYTKEMEADLKSAKKDRVFLVHSGCEEELLEEILEYLRGLERFEEVLLARAGGVISSHCGPGTLGVIYIAGN